MSKIIFMGTPDFSTSILEMLIENQFSTQDMPFNWITTSHRQVKIPIKYCYQKLQIINLKGIYSGQAL